MKTVNLYQNSMVLVWQQQQQVIFRDAKSWINFGWSRVLTENAFDKSTKVQTVSSTMSIIFISAKNLI